MLKTWVKWIWSLGYWELQALSANIKFWTIKISDSLTKWLSMMLTAHVHSTEQSNSGKWEKNMISRDDVSDSNSSELCYYDYIIKIFVQKNYFTLTRCFRENIYTYNVIVTIMEGKEQIFYVKWCVLASWLVRFYQRETEIKNRLLLLDMKLRNMNLCKHILVTQESWHWDISS